MTRNVSLPLAFLFVATLTVLRDLGNGSPLALAVAWGVVCLVGCAAVGVELVARFWVVLFPIAHARAAAIVFGCVLPVVLGLWRIADGDLPFVSFASAGVVGFGLVTAAGVGWLGRHESERVHAVGACWALCLFAPFVWTHDATGTWAMVRAGTEWLHLALFLGSWALALLVALGGAWNCRQPTFGWFERTAAAGLFATGVACLELERRALVDLYMAVHLWLEVVGLTLCALGASLSARAFPVLGSRSVLRPAMLVLGTGAALLTWFGPDLGSPAVRAQLRRVPLTVAVLELLPSRSISSVRATTHPALGYDRHLDAQPLGEKPNILFVTIDSLRPDALSEMTRLTPVLEESVVFTHAYAQGSRTAIAMSALMTGRYSATTDWSLVPYANGRIIGLEGSPKAQRPTHTFTTIPRVAPGNLLSERLRAVGYETSAVPFAGTNDFFHPELVFARGFDRFENLTGKDWKPPTSARLAEMALRTLRAAPSEPWFHWVHFYDPHESYRDPALYRELVGAVDAALLSVIEGLGSSGAWDRTALVLLSDHGEAFGEHGHQGHATSLYEEQIRIPVAFRLPGVPGRRIDDRVAAIDVTATLAAMTGAATRDLDGVNLLPRILGTAEYEPRPIFAELHRYASSKQELTHDLKAVVFRDHKLILDRRRHTEEFFDLRNDPREERNLVHSPSAEYTLLRDVLGSFLGPAEVAHPPPRAEDVRPPLGGIPTP